MEEKQGIDQKTLRDEARDFLGSDYTEAEIDAWLGELDGFVDAHVKMTREKYIGLTPGGPRPKSLGSRESTRGRGE